jgi:hypothetical protein
MIAVRGDEDLRLVHKSAESFRVDDAIPVALELVTNPVWRLGH